jgi:hypothetical protein
MGLGKARVGASVQGTEAASGTDNSLTDPRIVLFAQPVRPCIVANGTGNGNAIRIKVNAELNGTVSNDFDNDADDDGPGHITILDGETADASIGGCLSVHSVSIVTLDAADDLDLVTVVGWKD